MKLKFHYEVETIFDQKKEEVTINSFENEDPLVARNDAFSFFRNYINILKQEEQVVVNTKESSVRNHAQFRYDSRTPNFEHNLQAFFVSLSRPEISLHKLDLLWNIEIHPIKSAVSAITI